MTYKNAIILLKMQDRNIRKVNGMRFIEGDYEYRLTFMGGLSSYVAIDRRLTGKRNFKYFSGVGAYHCASIGDVMNLVMQKVQR